MYSPSERTVFSYSTIDDKRTTGAVMAQEVREVPVVIHEACREASAHGREGPRDLAS